MKKLTAILLAAMLVAGVSSCGSEPAPSGESGQPSPPSQTSQTPKEAGTSTEEFTIKVFSMRVSANPESEVVKQLNEKLHVKFEVTAVADADYDTKLNLFVASNSMPDVYGAQPTGTKDAMRAAATLDEDLIAKNMPDIYESFQSRVEKAGVSKDAILSRWTFDGKLKGFSNGNGQIAPYGIIIRTDVLKELGVEIPQTIEDWDAVLALYKEKYPEKYPLTRMNGQDSQAFYMFIAAYGVRRDDWALVDNRLEYAPFAPGMRSALLQLNNWYQAGYVNPEYYAMYSQAGTEWSEFTNGNTFFGQMYHPNNPMEAPFNEGSIPANCLAVNPEATFGWCPFPTLGDGSKPVVWAGDTFSGYIPCFGGQLEKQPEKLDKVMQVWNDLFSEEDLLKLMRCGIEGKHYDLKDGVPVVRAEFNTNDAKGKEGFGWPFNGALDPVDELVPAFTAPFVTAQRQKLLSGPDGMYSRDVVTYSNDPRVNGPLISKSGEDLNAKNSAYLTEWNTMYTAVIIGQKTIEDYDAFIADWKKAVGDDLTQAANDTYLQQWLN